MAKITQLHKEIIEQLAESLDLDTDDFDDPQMQKLVDAKMIASAAAVIAASESKEMAARFLALEKSNSRLEQSGIERIISGIHAIAIGIAAIVPEGNKDELLELAKTFANRDSSVNVTTVGQANQSGDGSTITGDTSG